MDLRDTPLLKSYTTGCEGYSEPKYMQMVLRDKAAITSMEMVLSETADLSDMEAQLVNTVDLR